jgi:hypothetical protein
MLSTMRSHDQWNTTIYSNDDRYRGVKNLRTLVFMNEHDMTERGLANFDFVDITSFAKDGTTRHVYGYRFILAGAQAKSALLRDGNRWGDPHGTTATSHILKLAIEGFDNHDLNEHLCLSAMRAAGLVAVRTSVERFEDQTAIVDVTRVAGRAHQRIRDTSAACRDLG